jgi:hypothetical protein
METVKPRSDSEVREASQTKLNTMDAAIKEESLGLYSLAFDLHVCLGIEPQPEMQSESEWAQRRWRWEIGSMAQDNW